MARLGYFRALATRHAASILGAAYEMGRALLVISATFVE